MSEAPKEQPAPAPPIERRRNSVLERLRSRKPTDKARPGAVPPKGRKQAPPPRVQPAPQPPAPPQPAAPQPPAQQPQAEQPSPEGSIMEVLMARAMQSRKDNKPSADPGMAMLQALSHQVQTGQPLKSIEDIVVPHLGEMSSKIHLFLNAMAYHNMFERGSLLAMARWTLEKSLWDDLLQQKLDPTEKLALLQLAIREMDKVTSNLAQFQEGLETGGKGTTSDIETATEKVDRPLSKIEDPTAKALEGTSAVGREIARRLMKGAGDAATKIVNEALKTP